MCPVLRQQLEAETRRPATCPEGDQIDGYGRAKHGQAQLQRPGRLVERHVEGNGKRKDRDHADEGRDDHAGMVDEHATKAARGEMVEVAGQQVEAEMAIFELGGDADHRHHHQRRPQRHRLSRKKQVHEAEQEQECREAQMPGGWPALEPYDQQQGSHNTDRAEPLPDTQRCQTLHAFPKVQTHNSPGLI